MVAPVDVAGAIRARRIQYLKIASYSLAPLGLAFGVLLTWLVGFGTGAFLFALAALSPLSTVVLKRTGSTEVAAHFFMFCFLATLSALAWRSGGLHAPAVYALMTGAPMGILVLSRKGSSYWVAATAVELGVFGILEVTGVGVEQRFSAATNDVIAATTVVTVVLALYFLLLKYQQAFNEQVDAAMALQARLLGAQEEVRTSSDAFGSAALVVSGNENDLVEKMQHRASACDAALSAALDKIEVMVDSYRDITPRVRVLSERTDVIETHLSAVGRISDKLDLMALNVGLEAVRVGEQGKPFVTLAEDMRRISALAIEEIKSIRSDLREVSTQSTAVGSITDKSSTAAAATRVELTALSDSFAEVLRLFDASTAATLEARHLGQSQLETIERLLRLGSGGSHHG